MNDILVAAEDVRPTTDLTVQEAIRGHADPDGAAELLGAPHESVATEEPATTLDEFGD